jgi:hypothetical protein
MKAEDMDRRWQELAEEVMTGMKEWRLQHRKATFRQIEAALDERLARMRARMLEDVALASAAADAAEWSSADAPDEPGEAAPPVCTECGTPLTGRGAKARELQTQGGQTVRLEREYGVCPACGAGFFPPG